eukprot:s94_g69.t1
MQEAAGHVTSDISRQLQCNGGFERPTPVPELLLLAVQATFQNALLNTATKVTEQHQVESRYWQGLESPIA